MFKIGITECMEKIQGSFNRDSKVKLSIGIFYQA